MVARRSCHAARSAMPELPEVETSRRGIAPHIEGRRIVAVHVRERRLRWNLSEDVDQRLTGATIGKVGRRAKYLLIDTSGGTAILHLGMSGSVYVVDAGTPAGIHDHFDLELDSGKMLRYRDPRRFGSLHVANVPLEHPLLARLGPEPLGPELTGSYLWARSRGRRLAVKPFIMTSQIVVGVGNIYASESLFLAGIHPKRAAGRIALERYERLADAIRQVLEKAIRAGGTTLRDFYGGDGEAGYFKHELVVYDRAGKPCIRCGQAIVSAVIGQRASYYCRRCQT
jgi:formamidopyrimidine-DNA glycosylase